MIPSITKRLLLFGVAVLCCGAVNQLIEGKIEFEREDGSDAFVLDPEAGKTVELQTGSEKRLATYIRKGSRLDVDLPKKGLTARVEVSKERDRYILKSANGKLVKWTLLLEPDGDWRLLNAEGQRVLKVKLRDDGYKIVNAEDEQLGRVKIKSSKISIRDKSGKEVLRTDDTRSALAASCFQLTGLTMPEKGAFAVAVLAWPSKLAK